MFPALTGKEFEDLVEDIRKNGLREKLKSFNGQLLDGQNRQNACEVARVKPQYEAFKGTEREALDYVISLNLNRRHLDVGERAMLADELTKCRNSDISVAEAAQKLGVSRDSVQAARRIKKASPKLAAKVKTGKMTLHAAVKKIAPRIERRPASDPFSAYTSTPAPSLREQQKNNYTQSFENARKKTRGEVAHDHYLKMLGDKSGLVEWEQEIKFVRQAWEAAALAAFEHPF